MSVQFDTKRIIIFGDGLFYDTYYLSIAAELTGQRYEAIVKQVLGQWAEILADVQPDQETVFLPFSVGDEFVECLAATRTGRQIVLRSVSVDIEGHTLDLLNLHEFMVGLQEISQQYPENFGVYDQAELIRALKEAEPAPA